MIDVAKIDIPWVHRFRDRHGRWRQYYRRPGYKSVSLPAPGSDGFLAAYEAAGKRDMEGAGAERTVPGSLSALIASYYLSGTFGDLRASTQRNQRGQLERFRLEYGQAMVADFTPVLLEAIFEGMASRSQASNLRKRLRKLFRYAVKLGWLTTNPVRDTEAVKYRAVGHTPWSEADIAAYEARWPSGTRQRLALALLIYTGVRRSDVVTMGRQHIAGGRIRVQTLKTGAVVSLQIHPALKAEISAAAAGMTFLLTQYGKPFSAAGFSAWFVAQAAAAGLARRTPHGLRKAAGRRMAEAGCSSKEIGAVLGDKTLAEVERYTKDADLERLADNAATRTWGAS